MFSMPTQEFAAFLKTIAAEGISPKETSKKELDVLTCDEEIELIRHLGALTGEITEAAAALDPSKITKYAVELATLFHKFYNACRVRCDDEGLMYARLQLCLCTKPCLKMFWRYLKSTLPRQCNNI